MKKKSIGEMKWTEVEMAVYLVVGYLAVEQKKKVKDMMVVCHPTEKKNCKRIGLEVHADKNMNGIFVTYKR